VTVCIAFNHLGFDIWSTKDLFALIGPVVTRGIHLTCSVVVKPRARDCVRHICNTFEQEFISLAYRLVLK